MVANKVNTPGTTAYFLREHRVIEEKLGMRNLEKKEEERDKGERKIKKKKNKEQEEK